MTTEIRGFVVSGQILASKLGAPGWVGGRVCGAEWVRDGARGWAGDGRVVQNGCARLGGETAVWLKTGGGGGRPCVGTAA